MSDMNKVSEITAERSSPAASPLSKDVGWLAGFLTLAVCLRLYALDALPFHHDEAIHAYTSWSLSRGEPYRFDPVYHGPFLYWTNALVYVLFGASDFTARLLPALFSVALVGMPWLMRVQLGSVGWKCASALLLLSPTMSYFGRFLAHDNYCALFTLLLVWLGAGYRTRPDIGKAVAIGLVTGLFMATKAVVYIHVGLFAIFALLVLALDAFAPRWSRGWLLAETARMLRAGRWHLLAAVCVLGLVYVLLFTSFLTHPRGAWDGVFATLSYWGGQHANPRIPGPVWFYLPRLVLHEPTFWLCLPAIAWAASDRSRPFHVFLAFWSLSAFLVYSIAQEKVPWLMMHILLPMFLLVGCWLDDAWRWLARVPARTGKGMSRRLASVLGLVVLSWSAREMTWLTWRMPSDDPHLLTYMASSHEIQATAESIRAEHVGPGRIFVIGPPSWPLSWYLRDLPVSYGFYPGWEASASVVVVADEAQPEVEAAGFRHITRPLMTWWYPDPRLLLTSGLVDYLWHRRTELPQGTHSYRTYTRDMHATKAEQP